MCLFRVAEKPLIPTASAARDARLSFETVIEAIVRRLIALGTQFMRAGIESGL